MDLRREAQALNGHVARVPRYDLLVETRRTGADSAQVEITLVGIERAPRRARGIAQIELPRSSVSAPCFFESPLRLLRFPAAASPSRWSSISAFSPQRVPPRTRSLLRSSNSPSLARKRTACGSRLASKPSRVSLTDHGALHRRHFAPHTRCLTLPHLATQGRVVFRQLSTALRHRFGSLRCQPIIGLANWSNSVTTPG